VTISNVVMVQQTDRLRTTLRQGWSGLNGGKVSCYAAQPSVTLHNQDPP